MDIGLKRIFKNISYTFSSNIISLIVSAFITFMIPRYMGVEQYSYYQLYVFYTSYVGFFHFGWLDGIYLRYGGTYYDNLNKEKFGAQFRIFCILEIIIAVIIAVLGINFCKVSEKKIIFSFVSLFITISLPTTFLQYVLQCTNRIKENAIVIVIDKFIYFVLTLLLIFKTISFTTLILVNLVGKIVALGYAMYKCRDILLTKNKSISLSNAIQDALENVKIGINLMFANIAGMLLIGVVKFVIERQWDVVTFGKVSLTMSVSNMLMVAIRAIALVMFPILRRTEEEKLKEVYDILRIILMMVLLLILVAYYPIKVCLSLWLPQYADSLKYMALLFPMCIYECKMSMLIETYLKTLREEKKLLRVNLLSLGVAVMMTVIFAFGMKNLDLVMGAIVFIYAFRCIVAESILSRKININIVKDTILEVIMTGIFMLSSWSIGGGKGFLVYLLAYMLYVLVNQKKIKRVCYVLIRKFEK